MLEKRPPKKNVKFDLRKEDHALIKSFAKQSGMTISAYVIAACNEKARLEGLLAPNEPGIE